MVVSYCKSHLVAICVFVKGRDERFASLLVGGSQEQERKSRRNQIFHHRVWGLGRTYCEHVARTLHQQQQQEQQ